MKYFDIDSEKSTFLNQLNENKIVVREVHVIGEHVTDLQNPIKVTTNLPTGESYSYFFSPFLFFSNTRPGNKTDMKMEFVIPYCQYTDLIISSGPSKIIRFRLFYNSVEAEELIILVKKDLDGYTFSLTPLSKETILSKFKDARPVRNVFVGYDVKLNFETFIGKIEQHIIPALTDLSTNQLEQLGGIKYIDVSTNLEIHNI